jgi:hypothetical protein
MLRMIAAVLLGLSGGGCATIVTGTTQAISVNSEPSDADCTLKRDGQSLGTVKTPGLVTVKRDAKPIHVVCVKDAHDDGNHVMESKFESSTMGNLALGGIVGVMVDAASGANSRYDPVITVQLTPLSAANQAAARARKSEPPPEAASVASASPTVTAATPAPFLTGPWQAQNVLIADRSAATCARTNSSYSLNLAGDTFTVDNVNGRMLTMTVPADGRIEQPFRSPTGARLQIVGNARTRDLEIVNSISACRWKLTPV